MSNSAKPKALISLLQFTSRADFAANKKIIRELLQSLVADQPEGKAPPAHLVIIPEAFARFGAGEAAQGKYAEPLGSGPVQEFMQACCREFGVWILAGTMAIKGDDRYAAASLLFDANGELVSRYDKIHLFDAAVNDNTKTYQESKFTKPGEQLVVLDTPFGKLGLAVCYDLRFPEMFRALRNMGAELISLPSAFTKVTGAAHWQPLLQARAIENQVYLLAPNQTGTHDDGRETWGHSMVVNPWGEIVGELGAEPGVLTVELDLETLAKVRQQMPVQQHNQFKVQFIHD